MWQKAVTPDPVLLFRFSALTFNGHRIHYDHPYVTGVEGYPGLIVHGPSMGMVQIELARRANPDGFREASSSARWRQSMPERLFQSDARQEGDGGVATWIADRNGGLAQQGRTTFQ